MLRAGLIASLLVLTASLSARADGDPVAGAQKIKGLGCITCHGRDGLSKVPEAPHLAGQVPTYLTTSLQAYRSGDRKNEMMNMMAGPLTDADIADVASYYSAIAVSVTPPPKP